MSKIEVFYPSYTRKALTFTIDDGNMKYDKMLLDILKPVGIRGTFNLCSNIHAGKESLIREFYEGYGIANHCKHHPLAPSDSVEYIIADEPFDEESADATKVYRVDGKDGFFWRMQPNGWRQMVFADLYVRLARESLNELNAIFGEGSVRDFVWPYGEQNNAQIKAYVYSAHRSTRKTGCTRSLDGFAIPRNKQAWSYNADHTNLLEVMAEYEKYPDDGELKFFAFGVHSVDFENAARWDDLREFAEKYGRRPADFWYATVEEIFDYEQATAQLKVKDDSVENPSDITLYIAIDGQKTAIPPHRSISL